MVEIKYFLLILGICSLLATGTLAQSACASAIQGRQSEIVVQSDYTTIPAGQQTALLNIPDGKNFCPGLYLVGTEVVVCDYDVPPTVIFKNPNTVLVTRNGGAQQTASAYTNYYCDNKYP